MDLLTLALSATRRAMVGRISTHAGDEAANRIRRTPASLLAASIAAVVAATLGTAFAAALPPLRDAPAGENVSSSRLAPETIILFNAFPLPTLNASPAMITAGPDANLWFTEQGANRIGRIKPAAA